MLLMICTVLGDNLLQQAVYKHKIPDQIEKNKFVQNLYQFALGIAKIKVCFHS